MVDQINQQGLLHTPLEVGVVLDRLDLVVILMLEMVEMDSHLLLLV